MVAASLKSTLLKAGQSAFLDQLSNLNADQQQKLEAQLDEIDFAQVSEMRQLISQDTTTVDCTTQPFTEFVERGDVGARKSGKILLQQGVAGCLVVAGGQGSRLGVEGPKGMVKVTADGKSLFELLAEKVLAASRQTQTALPIAIMTSPLNHVQTVDFFQKNKNFGLAPSQLSFFQQGALPILNGNGELFLESEDTLAVGPSGNGVALEHLVSSGIFEHWLLRGVRIVTFVQIDNPLADPFDPELIGHHHESSNDVTLKCVRREDPNEAVGVIVTQNGKPKVIEYTELTEHDRTAKNKNGLLLHPLANISLFAFSMDFVKRVAADSNKSMPWHRAHKAVKYLNAAGNTLKPDEPNGWKFEKFIFDCLPLANRATALVYPRDEIFAPLKNASGSDSLDTVRAALEKQRLVQS